MYVKKPRSNPRNIIFAFCCLLVAVFFLSCQREWQPGMPLPIERVKIGVLHITNPFAETSGYSFAHQAGIEEMQRYLGLADEQILTVVNLDDSLPLSVESAIRSLIARGANIIIATSWGHMDACERLAKEFPGVIFAHASGYRSNDTNFTNFFGRIYQARYLSGIAAGAQTRTNRIGYVAAWGTENSEVTSGINAFAMGVERVNPDARIHVRVTHSWFDPMGETLAAIALIEEGCDVIAQHVDTPFPQIEAQRAGVWGIGYNTDMSIDAPDAVLTSVYWNWAVYYIYLVQSIIDGTFTTTPWVGSLADGMIGFAPLSGIVEWDPEVVRLIEEERYRIESGAFNVFGDLTEEEIRYSMNWYHWNVIY